MKDDNIGFLLKKARVHRKLLIRAMKNKVPCVRHKINYIKCLNEIIVEQIDKGVINHIQALYKFQRVQERINKI
jgi:hypothetical protein